VLKNKFKIGGVEVRENVCSICQFIQGYNQWWSSSFVLITDIWNRYIGGCWKTSSKL